MATNTPTSFRFPFESQISGLTPEVQQVHRNVWNAVVDIQKAVKILHSNSTANTSTIKTITQTVNNSGSSSTGVSSFNAMTGSVSYFPNLGYVNDQTGVTSYLTQLSDNGVLILVNDSSPVTVTLNSAISNPYFFFVENQGTATATLTPSLGLINGNASMPLLPGYFTMLFFDGSNWEAMILPIVPVTFTSVLHQWLKSYDGATGLFTATQPDFIDISGVASPSQLPNPTTSTLGGIEAIAAVSHQWIDSISTSGVPHQSQPAYGDISGAPLPYLTGNTAILGGSPMTTGQTITATATVTGATTTMVAVCSPQTYPGDGFCWDSYVSAVDTVTVSLTCVAATGTPTAAVYSVRVIQ